MDRVVVPELLDDDRGTQREIADSLADLRMLNRFFGGVATTASLLRIVAQRKGLRRVTMLDVAGASGDVATGAQADLAESGIELEPVVLDRAQSHLVPFTVTALCGSAFELPFADHSFDVVGCSLFLHHLQPDEIRQVLAESVRVCRHAVIINDLRRGRFHWLAAKAGSLIYRSAITRHDAPVSVRRAYTSAEMRTILEEAGYPATEFSHHFFFRMGIVIWRREIP